MIREVPPHPALAQGPIYLDYNGSTPVDPRVVEAMLPYLTIHFGNPSSTHFYAHKPHAAIEAARKQVARLLGCTPAEIIFTGGGSESDALALYGVALANRERGKHIITQATEHPAVLKVYRQLERLQGFQVTVLPVDATGRVRPEEVEAAIDEQTTLVSIMAANNETGTLQPIAQVSEIVHRHGALMHTDASQAAGKIPIDVTETGVDLLTVAGHKLYAPKGIGALFVRRGVQLEPIQPGGGQERGLRAGTENVAAIVALGAACELAASCLQEEQKRLTGLRDALFQQLCESLPGLIHLNGHPSERLPNTLNVSVDGVIGEEVLAGTPEIAAATGSACHAGSTSPSEILLAMGIERSRALGALRLTLGRWSTGSEVEQAARLLAQTVQTRLSSISCRKGEER
ncbi:cysteine desulfurase [Ktedonosporobacter rubrisoli]|uniref:cysteine desulfurase n=1 Tax=Ktedonosporobacter rubrisoli TaxID=2509675 RepID=A0A4P6JTF7_KTERU|nr:cysteine desulfurase family protein [Ktedonosporobacter rubrisoli]QBD78857.1 cysteine desulfurase [Ktedonosporobacter rubrisoli]